MENLNEYFINAKTLILDNEEKKAEFSKYLISKIENQSDFYVMIVEISHLCDKVVLEA